MSGQETECEQANPEKTGRSSPIIVDREDEAHKCPDQKNKAEQPLWVWLKKFGDPLTVVTLLLFMATVGLFCATRNLVNDAERATEANVRAYIAITSIKWDGAPEVGKNQRLKILFENVGREAASDFILLSEWSNGTIPVTIDLKKMPYIDIQTGPWPLNTLCRDNPSRYINRKAVYPSTKNEFITYGFNNPPYLPQGVMDGTEYFYVVGCAIYRSAVTKEVVHHSPFCLYLQPKRDEPIDKWTFEFCPIGSPNAD